jgi:predicted MFS family arabinose efflux permease
LIIILGPALGALVFQWPGGFAAPFFAIGILNLIGGGLVIVTLPKIDDITESDKKMTISSILKVGMNNDNIQL